VARRRKRCPSARSCRPSQGPIPRSTKPSGSPLFVRQRLRWPGSLGVYRRRSGLRRRCAACLHELEQPRRGHRRRWPRLGYASGAEAAHGVGDKHAGTDQANAGRCDQRRDCTGAHAPPRAPAQASGGIGVEQASKDEVGTLQPPPITNGKRANRVALPVVRLPSCPDRREGDDEQRPG
jgi:hypothetical protein